MSNPPPECPMHKKEEPKPAPPPECPMHKKEEPKPAPPPSCPMHNKEDELNQRNMMPNLTQEQQNDQTVELPTERVISSIPKDNSYAQKWEYPSPQQFYNALRRKGWETPEEHVETMVDIHNFLNEEAWDQVLKWENMRACPCEEDPYLVRLQGRPKDLSPKAWWHSLWGSPRPFDRHDWYIGRCGQERRYVIDYYEGAEETPGVPVFFLDVRPALDDAGSIFCRAKAAAQDKWAEWFSSKKEGGNPSSSTA